MNKLLSLFAFPQIEAIVSLLDAGGPVLDLLLGVAIVLWALIIERFIFVRFLYPSQVKLAREELAKRFSDGSKIHVRAVRDMLISELLGSLSSTRSLIVALIAVSPLLGLLGTVTGMVEVFDSMAITRNEDIRAMASGVSQATITTMAGMVVALSAMYPRTQLERRIQKERTRLENLLSDRSLKPSTPEAA